MWNSLIGAICKLVILFLLESNPSFGIMGVAVSMSVGIVLVTLLHLATLNKLIQFYISLKDLFRIGLLILITVIIGYGFISYFTQLSYNISTFNFILH